MDGFTGNVILKTVEGVATLLMDMLRQELTASWPRKLAALMLKPAFRSVGKKLDYASIGGAPLLGVDGAVIISHGRSSATAIENAIGAATRTVEHDLAGEISKRVSVTLEAAAGTSSES